MKPFKECFEVGKKYSVYFINAMAMTSASEIIVMDKKENGMPIFKYAGKRKLFSFGSMRPCEFLIFEGFDQPIKTDMQTSRMWRGNACLNFCGDPEAIRGWIDQYQLNSDFNEHEKVLAHLDLNGDGVLVYPEKYHGGHAVIDRILSKK